MPVEVVPVLRQEGLELRHQVAFRLVVLLGPVDFLTVLSFGVAVSIGSSSKRRIIFSRILEQRM